MRLLCNVELFSLDNYSYSDSPDDVRFSNDNALIFSSICKESNMLMSNNLNTPVKYFPGPTGKRVGVQTRCCLLTPFTLSRV